MNERRLSYPEAILDATDQSMAADPNVLVLGLGVDDPKAILGTTRGLAQKYGPERVFDTPLSEDAMTGIAIGMSLAGLRPIHVHIRVDFLMLAMNQLINMAAKMHYTCGGRESVPMVVRAIIGKSWGQGAQHSQALHSLFMHVPGLKVAAPASPYDAKGCLISAIRDANPVVFIEHRLLYYQRSHVPESAYETHPGKSRLVRAGADITIVGISFMQVECFRAANYLEERGIHAEIIDPIWLSPLDSDTIVKSVMKTGRLLVVDNAWLMCGASAEIVAQVSEKLPPGFHPEIRRMGFAAVPCPTTPALEEHFYPNARTIAAMAYTMVSGGAESWLPEKQAQVETLEFKGPF
jgi:pyruvate/2-oxoglutarate/acetoin dehydrogenase E1 component